MHKRFASVNQSATKYREPIRSYDTHAASSMKRKNIKSYILTVVTVTVKNCGGRVPIMFVTVWRIASTTYMSNREKWFDFSRLVMEKKSIASIFALVRQIFYSF